MVKHKNIKIKYLCGNSSVGKNISFFDKSLKSKKLPNIIRFDNLDMTSKGEKIDGTLPKYSIIEDKGNYFLNFKIKSEDIKGITKNNIVFKRNLKQYKRLYNADNGWFLDKSKETYRTCIEVTNIEGKYVDLGNSSARVDGFIKSGLVRLAKGIHVIEVSPSTYEEVEDDALDEEILQSKDILYPYNHKYLFQGYEYPSSFAGEKLYLGFERICKFYKKRCVY